MVAVPSASVFGCYLCHSTQINGLVINNSVIKCGAGGAAGNRCEGGGFLKVIESAIGCENSRVFVFY